MAKTSCFTAQVDLALASKLTQDLKGQGFSFSQPPYTVFSAKKTGVSCTLYESGKLTVQGKEMDAFIEFYLEPEILKTFRFSHPEAHLDLTPRIGMDEAGKGDFYGPLCVAALYADAEGVKKLHSLGVRDSKTFSDASILKLAPKIRESFLYTVIRLFPAKYNELYTKFKSLNRLMAWAHVAALGDVSAKSGCKQAILDQFADPAVVGRALKQKNLELELTQKVRAEEDPVVAGASILARAAFLDGMKRLSEEVGTELPKGAAAIVIQVGKKLVKEQGPEILTKVAKTHFKTTAQVLS